jgi:hypothetical protein
MPISSKQTDLFTAVVKKASLKQEIYRRSLDVLVKFKKSAESLALHYGEVIKQTQYPIPFEYKEISLFEFELKFGSDVLVFFMHTNVFEIPRDHEIMKLPYIKEDKTRSYCGIIHIFNFLNDSFKYNRLNDVGYLIGRIFINKEDHYFIEGKREVGLLYNNFPDAVLNEEAIDSIIESSISYTINFDLLTPPFDDMKEVTVEEMLNVRDKMQIRTGKRLGFKFQADTIEEA